MSLFMKITHIKYFVAVYEEGSFTAAADRENATQPGVSMQIKELETLTGTVLFKRSASGVTPTAEGKWFYDRARKVLSDVRSLEQGITSLGKVVIGTVHAGLMPAFTRNVLAPAVESFTQSFPQANLNIVEAYSGSLTERVGRGLLDFAIVPSETVPKNISTHHFATDTEYFVQSEKNNQGQLSPVTLAGKRDLRLIIPGNGNIRRELLNAFFERHDIRPVEILELDTMMGTLDLIARGGWSAILPGVLGLAENSEEGRTVHPISDGELKLDYMLIKSSTKPISTASEEFISLLKMEVKKMTDKSLITS